MQIFRKIESVNESSINIRHLIAQYRKSQDFESLFGELTKTSILFLEPSNLDFFINIFKSKRI